MMFNYGDTENTVQTRIRVCVERVAQRYSNALCRTHWAGMATMTAQYLARDRWMAAWRGLGERLYERAADTECDPMAEGAVYRRQPGARDATADDDPAYPADLCQPRHTTLADDQEPQRAPLRHGDEVVPSVAARTGSRV